MPEQLDPDEAEYRYNLELPEPYQDYEQVEKGQR